MWMNKKIFSGIRMVRPLKKAAVCFAAAGFLGGLAFCAPAWAQDDPVSMDVSYGYEDSAKGGRYLPVNVTIQNNQAAKRRATTFRWVRQPMNWSCLWQMIPTMCF